jgi:hypothetical protein
MKPPALLGAPAGGSPHPGPAGTRHPCPVSPHGLTSKPIRQPASASRARPAPARCQGDDQNSGGLKIFLKPRRPFLPGSRRKLGPSGAWDRPQRLLPRRWRDLEPIRSFFIPRWPLRRSIAGKPRSNPARWPAALPRGSSGLRTPGCAAGPRACPSRAHSTARSDSSQATSS